MPLVSLCPQMRDVSCRAMSCVLITPTRKARHACRLWHDPCHETHAMSVSFSTDTYGSVLCQIAQHKLRTYPQ